MKRLQRVVLYGDSLVLAGLNASFEACASFEVISLKAGIANREKLRALQPDVIIFDTCSVLPDFQSVIGQILTSVILIGIDSNQNMAHIWSRQQLSDLSTQSLVEMIDQKDIDEGRLP